jgi:hypothetical protein
MPRIEEFPPSSFLSSSTRVQQHVEIIISLHSIYINGKSYLPVLAGGQNHAHM